MNEGNKKHGKYLQKSDLIVIKDWDSPRLYSIFIYSEHLLFIIVVYTHLKHYRKNILPFQWVVQETALDSLTFIFYKFFLEIVDLTV